MEDLFKKFLYTGVGLAALAAERLQEAVDGMVGEGKVSEEEGKKIVNEFSSDVEQRRTDFEARIKEMTDKMATGFGFPKVVSNAEYENIVARLAAIEANLGIVAPTVEDHVSEAQADVQEAVEEVKAEVAEVVEEAKATAKKATSRGRKTTTKAKTETETTTEAEA